MRNWLFMLALTMAMIGVEPIRAEGSDVSGNPLDRLAWLVGTWAAEGTRPDGTPTTTRVSYQWSNHRKTIRYSLVQKAGDEILSSLDGLCGWHPVKEKIVLWEINSRGDLIEGVIEPRENGTYHEENIYGADGTTLPVRVELVREGDDGFGFKALIEKNKEWIVAFETIYRRER